MNIGDLNRRVTVRRWGSTVDDAGGAGKVEISSWTKWAKVENRSGGMMVSENQVQFRYDFKIVMRYEVSRPTRPEYTLTYDSFNMKIHSVSIDSEGQRQFEILRCSVISINSES